MTNEELNERFSLMAESVSQVEDAANGIRTLEATVSRGDAQEQTEVVSESTDFWDRLAEREQVFNKILRKDEERFNALLQESTQRYQEFKQRQEESDRRHAESVREFYILIEELRAYRLRKEQERNGEAA